MSGETDTGTFADFMEGFKTFDREGQGYISAAEVRHVLTCMGKCGLSLEKYFRGRFYKGI